MKSDAQIYADAAKRRAERVPDLRGGWTRIPVVVVRRKRPPPSAGPVTVSPKPKPLSPLKQEAEP